MASSRPLNIGITCYPTVGGSGVLASSLGEELAARGHGVHFISYEKPFRVSLERPGIHFHPVEINEYALFRYPDYTLPLSVKMAEVAETAGLDVLHVHYAVPHATAAVLACSMLKPECRPKLVTTLHGTDTTLLGRDPGYGPAIRHALTCSDAVTAVSTWLADETHRLLGFDGPIEVIPNFFAPRPATRPIAAVRAELGLGDGAMLLHLSNLRPVKRVDLLLDAVARMRRRDGFKLVILAGGEFAPFVDHVRRLGIGDRVVVRHNVNAVEDYLQAADLAVFPSETESFCLSALEAMCFGVPSVCTAVGGVPEVIDDEVNGVLVPPGDAGAVAAAIDALLDDPARRRRLGESGRKRASERYSAPTVVGRYEALYRRVTG